MGKVIYYSINSQDEVYVTYEYSHYTNIPDNVSTYSGNVVIPSSVVYSGKSYSVTGIGMYAFLNCRGITAVTIPSSVKWINEGAFEGCKNLTSVTIPEGVSTIAKLTFCGSGITSVTIPESVTFIDYWAFAKCDNLTKVSIPKNVTKMGQSVFYQNKLEEVYCYPQTPPSIYDNTFLSNWSAKLYVPHGCLNAYKTATGWSKFENIIDNLGIEVVSISFPSSTEIFPAAGEYRTLQLSPIINPSYFPIDGLTWTSSDESIATVSNTGLVTNKSFGTVTITASAPNGVSASCRLIIYNKNKVVYVGNIFYNLLTEGAEVTNCCGGTPSNLSKERGEYSGTINIPNSVTYDGITYPVTAVGNYAFYYQPGLQAVVMPQSIIQIKENSFEKSKNLARIAFMNPQGNLASIGNRAFYECSKLNNVVLPHSVLRIDHSAFRNCSSLSSVTLSNSLNYINEYAFADCHVLDNVILPQNLKSIQMAAFSNDKSLHEITFPAGLEGIGATAFSNCTGLEEVTFNTNHYTMTIGENAFLGSNAIQRVYVSDLGSWVSTNFYNPEANPASIARHLYSKSGNEITRAVIPEGPVYLNNNVFYNCSSLTEIDIPQSVQFINDNIFYGCSYLTVIARPTVPPTFIGVDYPGKMNTMFNTSHLIVQTGAGPSYKSDSWWMRFSDIQLIDVLPSGIDQVEIDYTRMPVRKEIKGGKVVIVKGEESYTIGGIHYDTK
jgi:uncharacterized protein YjdB